jgi:uncharacterized OsmC-like protein
MTKTRIVRAKVRVLIHWYLTGSVIKGTVDSGCKEVETHLEIDSDDAPDKVAHVVRLAKKGCFAEQMVVRPVPLTGSIRINGEPFAL